MYMGIVFVTFWCSGAPRTQWQCFNFQKCTFRAYAASRRCTWALFLARLDAREHCGRSGSAFIPENVLFARTLRRENVHAQWHQNEQSTKLVPKSSATEFSQSLTLDISAKNTCTNMILRPFDRPEFFAHSGSPAIPNQVHFVRSLGRLPAKYTCIYAHLIAAIQN